MLAEGSSISFVSLLITRYRQKNKYQLKQLLCTSTKHAASVPAESFSKTSTAESRPTLAANRRGFTNFKNSAFVLKCFCSKKIFIKFLFGGQKFGILYFKKFPLAGEIFNANSNYSVTSNGATEFLSFFELLFLKDFVCKF